MKQFFRFCAQLLLCAISPALLLISAISLGAADLFFLLFGKKRLTAAEAPKTRAASVVIPSWNGRDLLEKFLPSVIAATGNRPENEVIVVDNGSTDETVEFVREGFPRVRALALDRNLGFGGASNAGVKAAKNGIVVLLNNDMRVDEAFLGPLLEPFSDPLVFSVSSQIFFADPVKRREETGLTEAWWERGRIRVSHRVDASIRGLFPCAYPGGGSSAFDRKKFLELGGFDELFRPFYFEDTDLGHLAWKRGWKALYQPRSVVHHEHRGTIGSRYSRDFIEGVLKKNAMLYCWKNIHDWRMLAAHFGAVFASSVSAMLSGEAAGRYTFLGLWRAFLRLGDVVKARWRARTLAAVSDKEALRRTLGGYYRDRFAAQTEPASERLQVLFVSPYPIEPPVHGGAVFMKQTLTALRPFADVHLISFVDKAEQLADQEALREACASAEFFVRHVIPPRNPSTLVPHAIREFADRDFAWAIHRAIYLRDIDVVQLEYTLLGQYGGEYERIPCMLFEHDIFFQSLERAIRAGKLSAVAVLEYLRMLRHELGMLKRMTRVQVCSRENARYLLGFLPELKGRMDADLRAGIDTSRYRYVTRGRERNTMLFVGSFRHAPNEEAVKWFVREVLPAVLKSKREAKLIVVGSEAPASLRDLGDHPNVQFTGFVQDIREPLEQYAVFVCPILSGSGMRVKLLEAFASGMPVVSTRIGAEGLAERSGEVSELADEPEAFASAVVRLLDDDEYARALAERARGMVEREKDSRVLGERLAAVYRAEVERRRTVAWKAAVIEQQV
ncbi:MAG: glycosyltransferase [Acidobacteriaceae bacterium]|nr:glycosyltransferase [Acidobacteriaceae bacterium]MBV9780749.1 glycosyltransferase [Acidobacteriaceae bacterium]